MSSSEVYVLMQNLIESERQLLQARNMPFNSENFYKNLRDITGEKFSSELKVWINWFLESPLFHEEEKKSLSIVCRILEIEKNSISKLESKNMLRE